MEHVLVKIARSVVECMEGFEGIDDADFEALAGLTGSIERITSAKLLHAFPAPSGLHCGLSIPDKTKFLLQYELSHPDGFCIDLLMHGVQEWIVLYRPYRVGSGSEFSGSDAVALSRWVDANFKNRPMKSGKRGARVAA